MKKNSGITLLALIITIIIMLILAGVTISIVGGSDGIVAKAEKAVSQTDKAAMQEDAELSIAAIKMDYYEEYATNRAKYANAKAFIVDKLKTPYSTSRGATMVADSAGNVTYTYKSVATELTLTDDGSVALGDSSSEPSEPEGPAIPEGLAVGQTVSYSPSGTYKWENKYATSESTVEYYTLATGSSVTSGTQDMTINTWKVLSIDETTGEVELVPSAPTTNNVVFQGAQGYNNAVKLLNDSCSSLYGNSNKGISARSINFEDFESQLSQETKDYLYSTLNSYVAQTYTWLDENLQIKNAYTSNQRYPAIYEQEDLSTITYSGQATETKIAKGAGLGVSEQTSFIERDALGAVSKEKAYVGTMSASVSIRPYLTWSVVDNQSATTALGEKANLLIPQGTSTYYWVASRCVDAYDERCGFDVRCMKDGGFNSGRLYNSFGEGFQEQNSLFPVVTLSGKLLTGNATSGWSVK